MIESKIKGKPFDRPDTLEAANAYEAFLQWEKEHIEEWIETEKPIHDEDYWFAGTLDAIAKLKTGEIACIDFKTSKGHYDGFGMQLAAYGFARPKLKGTHKIVSRFGEYLIDYKPIKTIQKYICLRIDKLTGQPDPKDYTKNIVREYHRFLAGLEYWYLKGDVQMIKITAVSEKRPVEKETFTRKDGQTGECWKRWVKLEGKEEAVQVKAFSQQFINDLNPGEYNVKNEYKGAYTLEAPKKSFGGGGGGRGRTQYSIEEYNKLYDYGLKKIVKLSSQTSMIDKDNISSFFGTWFIGATNSGVKV
jgi:hypothetical protein